MAMIAVTTTKTLGTGENRIMKMVNNWIVVFDDGSEATYMGMNIVDALNVAVRDWYPRKRPVSWRVYGTPWHETCSV